MDNSKILYDGITFDDVLLVPRYSEILPRDVSLRTRVARGIELNIPILSAAMDTVTESDMAIALAREGGIGARRWHRSIERQADEVDKVKRSESGMIRNPITLMAENTILDARNLMAKYRIAGIPVVDGNQKLIGILTNRDLRFVRDMRERVGDVMTKDNLIVAPLGTTLDGAETILQQHRIEKLPVVDGDGILRGLITFKDIQKKKKYPASCKDEQGRLRVGAAVGVTPDTIDRVGALFAAGLDMVIVDTAHGHSRGVIDMVRLVKEKFPTLQVVGGNIATADAAQALIDAGADGVKVGIGPGSICTTRIIAGVGVPQLSAIMDVAAVASAHGVPVIADGGIKQTGDIAKAIAAGADCVMMGGMLAGHEESPGEKVQLEGRAFKVYRGMGSQGAMMAGSADRYFQDVEDEISKLVPEGIEGRVPFKGSVSDTIYQMTGGLRAAMGYCGAGTIAHMKSDARFVKITAAGLKESHPHNVTITKESPNYFG
ncbi:MAG: IMP dehydrogenase [Candidatus Kapabacteria bacterium]|nr:IMP dehydrogenase [Candidatus Kapabacteria bacterium]